MLTAVAHCCASIAVTCAHGLKTTLLSRPRALVRDTRRLAATGPLHLLKLPWRIIVELVKAALSIPALLVAALLEACGGHRRLTDEERQIAETVFGSSIPMDRLKIACRSKPSDWANRLNKARPFTTMYVVNFASWCRVDQRTLVHELTHVWQAHVEGPVYMLEALHAQWFGDGYTVTERHLAEAGGDFSRFNREQQAVIVERYWSRRHGGDAGDWRNYERYAKQVFHPIATRSESESARDRG